MFFFTIFMCATELPFGQNLPNGNSVVSIKNVNIYLFFKKSNELLFGLLHSAYFTQTQRQTESEVF